MRYWGKVIFLILCLMSGMGFWSIVLAFIIKDLLSRIFIKNSNSYSTNNQVRQNTFFTITFQIMGHLTKSKGRVTQDDIRIATSFMDQMQLQGDRRKAAQIAFREGKSKYYPLRDKLSELRIVCYNRSDLLYMFIEIQIKTAFSDAVLDNKEREILYIITEELGVSPDQFNSILRTIENTQQFTSNSNKDTHNNNYRQKSYDLNLIDAYNILGIKDNDDYHHIKRAYRKMMSANHPDKLIAKGLPPEMMEVAKHKTQEIQAAYDFIRKEKGFK